MSNFFRSRKFLFIVPIITLLFVLSPLLVRNSVIRSIVQFILSSLPRTEYKSSYIESLGSLLGSFLGVTGALWTHSYIEKQDAKKQSAINALIVYHDFSSAISNILKIMYEIYPLTKSDNLGRDIIAINKFRSLLEDNRFSIEPNLRTLILSLKDTLPLAELHTALSLYASLSSIISNNSTNNTQLDDFSTTQSYSTMCSIITAKKISTGENKYEITKNEDIDLLLQHLSRIADL